MDPNHETTGARIEVQWCHTGLLSCAATGQAPRTAAAL